MGFSDGRIILNSENGVYYPGQRLCGRLEFDQETVKTFRGIYVKIKGFCKIHWTTQHSRREGDRDVHYTVTHESYEEYIRQKIYLAGSDSGDHHLQPGHHVFSFECPIPVNCPSSFEDSDGHIRYQIKIVVDRAFKLDQEKMALFRIVAPVDLNLIPSVREPIAFDFQQSFCCWCVSSGSATTLVKLPVSGFCPGQMMPIEVSCTNNSNVEIEEIVFMLTRETTFRAEMEPDSRHREEDIAELKKGPVPGNSSRNWVVEMLVPTIDVPNLDSCRFIDINYKFKVNITVPSCHEDESDLCYITIGTIPLVGFQDDVGNPLQDQLPKIQDIPQNTCYPPPPVTNQPLPNSYPNVPQYPGNNAPYPGANQPYPGAIQPYPGANQPYPGANQPYPGANQPYPGANQPFPASNQPYPNNVPYPNANMPASQPVPNVPYPNSSPYPGSEGPKFTVPTAGTTLLKAGDFGFTGHAGPAPDPVTIPLLPQGANVPYPRPASPYSAATAPEPATPDCEPSPAYNPNYREKDSTNKQN
ncbi:arrestin domain-containing protein 17 [Bombyx mori]|uniref:Arrestin C-terminal-like domain-containing protein n=1 Tax=Bombyx mori TaxID=7091 RepID=A0A8R2G7S1_BOMMO|nr:arrestin domain-containing protein 17 [Bombyx mori]